MADAVKEQKRVWRRMAGEMFALVDPETRGELDRAIVRKMEECAATRDAKYLLGFAPMRDEPDIAPFFRQWLRQGRSLVMPVWPGESTMILRRVRDWERDLRQAKSGIREPLDTLPEVMPEEIDVAVVPGRFFSETCRRLGRGAGCYDRLVRGRTMHRVGVAYDFQIFPAIPASGDDEAMDIVVTPSRVIERPTDRNASCPIPAIR